MVMRRLQDQFNDMTPEKRAGYQERGGFEEYFPQRPRKKSNLGKMVVGVVLAGTIAVATYFALTGNSESTSPEQVTPADSLEYTISAEGDTIYTERR